MLEMSSRTGTRGRPRTFDTDQILEQSVEVFWQQGFSGTTTRNLEDALGISQSSLYNAFGSKEKLFEQVIARYEERLDAAVLTPLQADDADRAALSTFVDSVASWVSDDAHRGCLVLNLGAETEDGARRVSAYRTKLRSLITPAIESFTDEPGDVEARTELLLAAILGLNISARSGADGDELLGLRDGIKHQIQAW